MTLQNIFGVVQTPGSALTLTLCEYYLPKKLNRMNKLYRIFAVILLIFILTSVVITPLNENGGGSGNLWCAFVEILFCLVVFWGFFLFWVGFFKLLLQIKVVVQEKKSLQCSRPSWVAECAWMGGSDIPDFSSLEPPMGALGARSS